MKCRRWAIAARGAQAVLRERGRGARGLRAGALAQPRRSLSSLALLADGCSSTWCQPERASALPLASGAGLRCSSRRRDFGLRSPLRGSVDAPRRSLALVWSLQGVWWMPPCSPAAWRSLQVAVMSCREARCFEDQVHGGWRSEAKVGVLRRNCVCMKEVTPLF